MNRVQTENVGTAAFLLIFSFLNVYICMLQRELIPMKAFMIVFLLTVLAGPCALVRYALPYILCLPTMGACVLLPGGKRE